MLVLIQVSSMKTRRPDQADVDGFFHRIRNRATFGRSCSLATSVFFEGLALAAQEAPDSVMRHVDPRRLQLRRQRTHRPVGLDLQPLTHRIGRSAPQCRLAYPPIFAGIRPLPSRSRCPITDRCCSRHPKPLRCGTNGHAVLQRRCNARSQIKEIEVAPSLLASNPAMILNHKNQINGNPVAIPINDDRL